MKIALVFLPVRLPHAPSLGPTCLAAWLEKHGHDVTLLDYNIKIYNQIDESHYPLWNMDQSSKWNDINIYRSSIEPHIKKYFRQLVADIIKLKVDAVGFTILNVNYFPANTAISMLRLMMPDLKIFYGGPNVIEASALHDMKQGKIDAAIMGEAENSCLDLLNMWDSNEDRAVPGCIVKTKTGEILKAPSRPLLNLKELPMPNFDSYDLSIYHSDYLPIEFSRGCPASCTFCSETNFWVSYRVKKAQQVFEEFKHYSAVNDIHEFRVVDSLLNGNHVMLEELCDLIIAAKLDITWYGFCRIDIKLTPPLLSKMKAAGCDFVTFGIESGSQNVLDLMKKGYKISDIHEVVKNTHKAGVGVHTQILVGFPGESWYNFYETLKMLWKLKPHFQRIYPGVPLSITPNTDIYANLKKYNVSSKSRGGEWHTNYFTNTIYHRNLKGAILRHFLKWVKMDEGYPTAHALVGEFDRVDPVDAM